MPTAQAHSSGVGVRCSLNSSDACVRSSSSKSWIILASSTSSDAVSSGELLLDSLRLGPSSLPRALPLGVVNALLANELRDRTPCSVRSTALSYNVCTPGCVSVGRTSAGQSSARASSGLTRARVRRTGATGAGGLGGASGTGGDGARRGVALRTLLVSSFSRTCRQRRGVSGRRRKRRQQPRKRAPAPNDASRRRWGSQEPPARLPSANPARRASAPPPLRCRRRAAAGAAPPQPLRRVP